MSLQEGSAVALHWSLHQQRLEQLEKMIHCCEDGRWRNRTEGTETERAPERDTELYPLLTGRSTHAKWPEFQIPTTALCQLTPKARTKAHHEY